MTTGRATGAYAGSAILAAVAFSHLINDSFTALLTPLLPQIQSSYGITIAETAVLVAILSFMGSMIQPFMGIIADSADRRLLAALGPICASIGMTLMGYAPNFAALGALIALGGVGSAIFHPSGAAYAVLGAAPGRRGLFAALFSAAGTAGLAVGPLTATALDLRALPYLMPIGVLAGVISYMVTPSTPVIRVPGRRIRDYATIFRGPMRALWGMSVLRSTSTVAYQGLVGFALVARGYSGHIGPTLAVFNVAAAIGGIIGGRLSDRHGRTAVMRSSVLATIPLFIALVYSNPGQWWYYPLTAVVGGLVNANVPVTVVTAQEYAPAHIATASALMMGFAWGTSGVLFLAVGALADLTSPSSAMVASVLLLLPAWWLTLQLPEPTPIDAT
ncbi:MAG: MFS transporter [Gemmatimonadaceae bacterium]